MDTEQPQAAVLEIIERRRGKPDGAFGSDVVVPYEVRLNGQLLATPNGYPIKVHEMEVSIDGNKAVLATVTLFVRRLVVAAEWPDVEAEKRGDDARGRPANLDLIPDAALPATEVA